jgi:GT2 family glycosyltransferase
METVKTAMIIATKDRPEILRETLQSTRRQTWPAAHVYLSVSSLKDAPADSSAAGVTMPVGNSDVVAMTGTLLADGNISREAARALVEQDATWTREPSLRDRGPHHVLYACNAVIRSRPLRQTLCDENLPLYSYGEDYELSLRLKKFGKVGRLSNAVGVHLQTQAARV